MTARPPAELDADGIPAGARIVPARITMVLDAAGPLDGPQVDLACGTFEGNPDGDVDAWELGQAEPSREQARLIAQLARVPVALLYDPVTAAERSARGYICVRRGSSTKGGLRRGCYPIAGLPTPPAAEGPAVRPGRLF
jgi:hypothetical protein